MAKNRKKVNGRGGSGDKGTWLTELIEWVAYELGKRVAAWVVAKIRSVFRGYFKNRNILILGAKQTGKTSLINFLHANKPYEEVEGGKQPPNPTSGVAIVDKKVDINKRKRVKIPKDVGGEHAFRPLWAEMILDLRPEGIIYMIDGRLSAPKLRHAVDELRSDVLKHFERDAQELIALHVFMNYADKWASSPKEVRRRIRIVRDAVEKAIDGNAILENIRYDVSEIQLSPDAGAWTEATRAVHKFGAMLLEE
jgi:hypothetical protein